MVEDPAEDLVLSLTMLSEKPVMSRKRILVLLAGIEDLRDLCLLSIGIFCGPRASAVFGLRWKSWTGKALLPQGTPYEGRLYPGRLKTKASKGPIVVPKFVRPIIEALNRIAPDTSPEALMFPTFGRKERKGQLVPYSSKNFCGRGFDQLRFGWAFPVVSSPFR